MDFYKVSVIFCFTEIKLLLGRNGRSYKQPWIQIFQGQQIGTIDYQKLFNFFNDVIGFIQSAPVTILLTGTNWNVTHHISLIVKEKENWPIVFLL